MDKTNCQTSKTDSIKNVAGFLRFAHPATTPPPFKDPAAHPGPVYSDGYRHRRTGVVLSCSNHIIALNTGCEGGLFYNKEGV